MRVAVLADIHGNLLALEAVLADLRSHAPDLIVNLGDHVSGPLQAALTADLLISKRDWIHIRGNHDRQLIEHHPTAMGLSDRAAAAQLTTEHYNWLRALPPTAVIEGVLLCHGTPHSDLDYLLEDVSADGVKPAAIDTIRRHLSEPNAVTLCGHSHIPRLVELDENGIALNPGSVGLPAYNDPDHRFPHSMQTGTPHARYALLDQTNGRWQATFRVIDYDWEAAANIARSGNRPDWAHALRTGQPLPT